jgi:hypothetical protein
LIIHLSLHRAYPWLKTNKNTMVLLNTIIW